ncbi:MAG: hypothetical protein ACRDKE_00075 [Solirubrobacterales bacterium]
MDAADIALIEAWNLSVRDHTDEVEKRVDELLPTLIAAGFAESDRDEDPSNPYYTWCFTSKGVARAEELVPDHDLD